MVYLKNKETLAAIHGRGSLGRLGITTIP
jgi:hypothetical protein